MCTASWRTWLSQPSSYPTVCQNEVSNVQPIWLMMSVSFLLRGALALLNISTVVINGCNNGLSFSVVSEIEYSQSQKTQQNNIGRRSDWREQHGKVKEEEIVLPDTFFQRHVTGEDRTNQRIRTNWKIRSWFESVSLERSLGQNKWIETAR